MLKEIKFLDLKAQYPLIEKEIRTRFDDIISRTSFVSGKYVKEFEEAFAKFIGVKHVVAVSDGTSALLLPLLAKGIGAGDEVLLPVNTFIATAEAVSLSGAVPVFVDIDPNTFLIDLRDALNKITQKTKAIIPVDLYGRSVPIGEVMKIATKHNLFVLEDACQAHGAEDGGVRAGSRAHAGAFSFYPGKNLGTWGEGGAVVTNDGELAKKIKLLRDHGSPEKYVHDIVGGNFRMSEFEGAVLSVKLPHLLGWNEKRNRNAKLYERYLYDVSSIRTPEIPQEGFHVWHLYILRAENRDKLAVFLKEEGIQTGIHYPHPLHITPAYKHLGYTRGDFPNAEKVQSEILSLPMYAELPEDDIAYVAEKIKEFYAR